MAFQRGDVVLVPFPFTDLTAVKTRPAVVVSEPAFEQATGDITVAMITSRMHTTAYDQPLSDWQHARLLKPSTVRAKLATIGTATVRYRPGSLSERDLREVDRRLRQALAL